MAEAQKQVEAIKMQYKYSTAAHEQLILSVKVLESKYTRARKVASHMERLIKEAKPNFQMDFRTISDVEPSTQLAAALMARVHHI